MHFQLRWAYTACCMEHMNVNIPDWTIQCVQPLLILTIGPSNQEGGMAWIWMESPVLWHFCWVETPYLKIPNIHRLPCSEINHYWVGERIMTLRCLKCYQHIFMILLLYKHLPLGIRVWWLFCLDILNSLFSICFIVPSIVEFHLLILDTGIFEITKLIPLIHNYLQL